DSNANHYACKLYDKLFEKKEIYLNEKGKYYQVGDTLIFFKKIEVARTLADVAREEAEEKKKAEKAAE
ncbi:MAG: hypothetical protein UH678_09195, partial [Fibrobacteraceae bacterium]|nr:hypothetical protein [Fibrobacteraceae bacterium]